jgi:hypothetical protein
MAVHSVTLAGPVPLRMIGRKLIACSIDLDSPRRHPGECRNRERDGSAVRIDEKHEVIIAFDGQARF